MKRFCCKISVQTILITAVVTFLVFVLGFILNYSVIDHDKSENNIINRFISNEKTSKNVGGYEKSGLIPITYATVISSTIVLENNSNRKIIGAVLSGALFTAFYLTMMTCLQRRRKQLRRKLQNNIQNISLDIAQNEIAGRSLPVSIV